MARTEDGGADAGKDRADGRGPAGILQPVADFFKLTGKEEILPAYADKFVFELAPPLFFAAPAIGIVFLPVIGPNALVSNPLDLLFILFILAFSAFMAAMLGYSSCGRYSTIGIGRLILQYTSYEIPMIIADDNSRAHCRDLSLDGIVAAQSGYWYIVLAPISFACFIVAAMAELEKPPFDIPSAKTELVAGWMTEFSGRALAYVKLTKNLSYVFLSALAVTLFLGGPLGPMPATVWWAQDALPGLLLGQALRRGFPDLRHPLCAGEGQNRPGSRSLLERSHSTQPAPAGYRPAIEVIENATKKSR